MRIGLAGDDERPLVKFEVTPCASVGQFVARLQEKEKDTGISPKELAAGSIVLGRGDEAAVFPLTEECSYTKIMATAAAQKALRATPRALEMGFIKGPEKPYPG
jgi:hypothetical protein